MFGRAGYPRSSFFKHVKNVRNAEQTVTAARMAARYCKWHTSYFSFFFPLTDTSRRIKQLPFDATRMPGISGQLVCRVFLVVAANVSRHWNRVRVPLLFDEPPVHATASPVLPLWVPAQPPGGKSRRLFAELPAPLSTVLPADPPWGTGRFHKPPQRAGAKVFLPGRAEARVRVPRCIPPARSFANEPRFPVWHAPGPETAPGIRVRHTTTGSRRFAGK